MNKNEAVKKENWIMHFSLISRNLQIYVSWIEWESQRIMYFSRIDQYSCPTSHPFHTSISRQVGLGRIDGWVMAELGHVSMFFPDPLFSLYHHPSPLSSFSSLLPKLSQILSKICVSKSSFLLFIPSLISSPLPFPSYINPNLYFPSPSKPSNNSGRMTLISLSSLPNCNRSSLSFHSFSSSKPSTGQLHYNAQLPPLGPL